MVAGGLELIPDAGRRGYWEQVIDQALCKPPAAFARNSSGCVGAFQLALSAIAHAETSGGGLVDSLQLCVAAGGDTDTTAAICGALLGAIHGASAVPAKWRSKLHGWPSVKAAGPGAAGAAGCRACGRESSGRPG